MNDISLAQIESLTKKFSDAHSGLEVIVRELNDKIDRIKRDALPEIKRAVARAAEHKNNLANAVDSARSLFVQPRTVVFHGIKVGLRKGKGGLDWEDNEQLVARIKKHFAPETGAADAYLKITEKPLASALEDLDAATLKKLGITIEDTGDVIVIQSTDSAVDKIVKALLADATDESQAEAA